MPEVCFYTDPLQFEARVQPFLLLREAENNLLLGLLPGLAKGIYKKFWMATVEEEGEVLGCVAQTPPWRLVLPRMPAYALASLVDVLLVRSPALEGVNGPLEMVEAFCARWTPRTGAEVVLEMNQGVYALSQVQSPANPAPGGMRVIQVEDLSFLGSWVDGFQQATGLPNSSAAARLLEARLAQGSLYVWETEGQPVSMAGWSGQTPHGVRVNLVYTPPEHRGRGFASILVAQVSQLLLDRGRECCFLYTDLGNPTSNRLYRRLGYHHVCDGQVVGFDYGAGRITP